MTRAISAVLRGAAFVLAIAVFPAAGADRAPHPASEWDGVGVARPMVERDLPAEPATSHVVEFYADVLLVLTALVAMLILLSSLDDAFIDAYYWLSGARRRKRGMHAAELAERPQCAFAIMVPAWKEHDVIAAMIENTVRTMDYSAFRIFCGVYRNDPATAREVDRMAQRYPDRVTRVDVPHDGPTCKADCLNHIVGRVLRDGEPFAGVVLHDSEDVIHPHELKLFNALLPQTDLVQLPVFSLGRAWREFTAATYIDDFAESHGKDIAVREALVGIVPGAGVATCYSRRALEVLSTNPFNTATLTEDYDLSFRLRRLGMSETFAHVTLDPGGVVCTREYFPDTFKAAYRQRARWILGIALQGWRQLGWRGGLAERYFLFRDRKVLLMAPAGAFAYLLLLNYVLGMAFGSPELQNALGSILSYSVLPYVLVVNLAFMCNRAIQRMVFVRGYYGAAQALLSLVRMPLNNLINFCAVMRAWRQFASHLLTGKKLAWDKTAHVFPDAVALAPAAA
jgi:bacteriophage N4 adsorption protein B